MGDGNILLNAVILGNRGNGKSSLGNCILQKKVFALSQADNAPSREPCYASGNFRNLALKVVDMPACPVISKDQLQLYRRMISDVFNKCEDNLHFFLLVIKFEKENCGKYLQVFDKWRQVLGKDIFEKWGIVVVTFGDEFASSMKTTKTPDKTFDDWCLDQQGDLSNLFKECHKRIVLIYSTADQNEHSFDNLFEHMRKLKYSYSKKAFMTYTESQRFLALQGDSADHTSDTQKQFTELRNDILGLWNNPSRVGLDAIDQRIENLKEKTNLSTEDKNTLSLWDDEVKDTKRKLLESDTAILKSTAEKMLSKTSHTFIDTGPVRLKKHTRGDIFAILLILGCVIYKYCIK